VQITCVGWEEDYEPCNDKKGRALWRSVSRCYNRICLKKGRKTTKTSVPVTCVRAVNTNQEYQHATLGGVCSFPEIQRDLSSFFINILLCQVTLI
jgi:hypothetical protein